MVTPSPEEPDEGEDAVATDSVKLEACVVEGADGSEEGVTIAAEDADLVACTIGVALDADGGDDAVATDGALLEARGVEGADGAEEGEDAIAAGGVDLVACVMGVALDADAG